MCTVTYIPLPSGFIMTSNRDESPLRETYDPQLANTGKERVLFPRDAVGGGTWFGLTDKGRCACLLNGGLQNYFKTETRLISRGIVVLGLLSSDNPDGYLANIDLNKVQPFTLILAHSYPSLILFEYRWDGDSLNTKKINPSLSYIWSSATLYNEDESRLRQKWFDDWIVKFRDLDDFNISLFHRFSHTHDDQIDLIMNRSNKIRTVSITQAIVQPDYHFLSYQDLLKGNLRKYIFERENKFQYAI